MDFVTFKEKLLDDDLKNLKMTETLQDWVDKKYQETEIYGLYRLNDSHRGLFFKHKLWEKLAIFRGDDWIETRVNSLTNKLPEECLAKLQKNLKKSSLKIIKIESVLSADGSFYFYVIAKISGKKSVLHVSREGEIELRSKFVDYHIKLDDEDDDDDDDDDNDDDDDSDDDDEIEEIDLSDDELDD